MKCFRQHESARLAPGILHTVAGRKLFFQLCLKNSRFWYSPRPRSEPVRLLAFLFNTTISIPLYVVVVLPCLLAETLAYTSRARPRRVAPRTFELYTRLPRMPK